jgi:hypothetical protein
MELKRHILENLDNPAELERLFRAEPKAFRQQFGDAYSEHPDSPVLNVWKERLFYQEEPDARAASQVLTNRVEIAMIIVLTLAAGTLARLPMLFPQLAEEPFYLRNFAFLVFPALAAYFIVRNPSSRKVWLPVAVVFLVAAAIMNLLRFRTDVPDALVRTAIHVTVFCWMVAGIAFAGNAAKDLSRRMDYLKFNGDLAIYTGLILLGGMVLTGLTAVMFQVIGMDISQWYLENVVVYGAVASPLVAVYLIERVVPSKTRIPPIIAKLFSPLFLVTLVVYLLVMLIQGKSPYTDRDFLLVFNAVLFLVLAMTFFAISERQSAKKRAISDYVNVALVAVTLVVDVVELSAIVFRLSSYGLTPNRLAVLGANIAIFGNLAGILVAYLRFFRGTRSIADVEAQVARYLPVYLVWSAIVAFAFPLIFGGR